MIFKELYETHYTEQTDIHTPHTWSYEYLIRYRKLMNTADYSLN